MFRIAGHLHLQQVNGGCVLCHGILEPFNGSPIVEHTVKDNGAVLRQCLNHVQKHNCGHQACFEISHCLSKIGIQKRRNDKVGLFLRLSWTSDNIPGIVTLTKT